MAEGDYKCPNCQGVAIKTKKGIFCPVCDEILAIKTDGSAVVIEKDVIEKINDRIDVLEGKQGTTEAPSQEPPADQGQADQDPPVDEDQSNDEPEEDEADIIPR